MVERFRSSGWLSFGLVYILALATLLPWPRLLSLTELFRSMPRQDPTFGAYQLVSAVIYLYPLFILVGVIGSMVSYYQGKTSRAISFLLLCFIPYAFAIISLLI